MQTKTFKRLPYGNSDFRDAMLQRYACADKTLKACLLLRPPMLMAAEE